MDDAEGATDLDANDTATEVEEPLLVDQLLGDLDDNIYDELMQSQESDGSCNSPMLDVIKMLLANMPAATHTHLLRVWQIMSAHSAERKLKTGSGCSGSGLDWHVIQALTEVLYACVVCMLLVMSS